MRLALGIAFALFAATATTTHAQASLTQGDVTVHYSAVATTTLDPEVARRYAITRTPTRALLSIVVLRTGAEGLPSSVAAAIRASATNAAGRRDTLALREIRDAGSISYLAEPRIAETDTLAFELVVTPEGEPAPIEIRFEQAFFPAARR